MRKCMLTNDVTKKKRFIIVCCCRVFIVVIIIIYLSFRICALIFNASNFNSHYTKYIWWSFHFVCMLVYARAQCFGIFFSKFLIVLISLLYLYCCWYYFFFLFRFDFDGAIGKFNGITCVCARRTLLCENKNESCSNTRRHIAYIPISSVCVSQRFFRSKNQFLVLFLSNWPSRYWYTDWVKQRMK